MFATGATVNVHVTASELVVVARGKTIQAPEGIYKPGDSIELPHDKVLRLISLGVVRRPGESAMTVDHWVRRVPLESLPRTFKHTYQPGPAVGMARR